MAHWTYFYLGTFVCAALLWDLRQQRIPNLLIALMVITALLLLYNAQGLQAVLNGLAGFALGLGAFLPLYIKGGMGAGDVKLMSAAGLFLGPMLTAQALLYTLLFGGLLATGILIWQRTRKKNDLSGTVRNIPYAPAIAAGVAASLVHPLF